MKKKTTASNGNGGDALAFKNEDFSFLDGKTVLVTGGTGSFGKRFTAAVLSRSKLKKLIIFSRDELKQFDMAAVVKDERIRFFIGDVRDGQRLSRAFDGVDFVVHAAALKQVPTLEYNPFEAILTNVVGAQNIINAAIDRGVERVVALSTDKAVNPVNLYGASKLCAEKLFVAGNSYAAARKTRFCVVRYGNVVGSRGSVIPAFIEKRKDGVLPVTDDRMTRFWITLDQGVSLVLRSLRLMHGGEIFVPRIPSMKITDLARVVAPSCKVKITGIRPGEKIHEALLTDDEAARCADIGGLYMVKPQFPWWGDGNYPEGKALPNGFRYSSEVNDCWLTEGQLLEMVQEVEKEGARAR